MKTQEEIVIQAKAYAESIGNEDGTSAYDYVIGYNQCQKDIDKEFEELRESIRKNTWYDENSNAQVNLYGVDNKLLNKQD
jgi:hypothetical protein